MESKNVKGVVLSYVRSLDAQDYETAGKYLSDHVHVIGPSGESFKEPGEFIDMLRQYRGKYDLKKVFAEGNDVCLLYDLTTPSATVYMCSWYQVEGGKIASIRTVFDPRSFGLPTSGKSE
jgi:hypothetical protein